MKRKNKLVLSFLLIANSFSLVKAQPVFVEKADARADGLIIPYEKWKLPNGLTIIVHEDHSDPVISVSVTYKVGSDRESIQKSGFAHFFEHMMFQGSSHVKDEEHFKIVSEAGGEMNGNTTRDRTFYYEDLPSNQLEVALWLESDRMGFLLDSLTSKKFENQRDAVKNEKGQRDNSPYGLLDELKDQTLYPLKHPYNWPVIGFIDDLNRASLQDVKNFFLRWYGPNNAILTVAGDVDAKEVLKLSEKYFGTIKQCPEVKKMKIAPFILSGDKYASYKDNVYFPLTMKVYPTIPLYHRDEPALDILAYLMGNGNNSIFYKNFVKNKLAIDANVNHSSSELAGEFSINIVAYPPEDMNLEKMFNNLETSTKTTIDEFEKSGITDEALQRAKAGIETLIMSSGTSVSGKASLLSEWERLLGKPYNLADELERYNKVTKDDLIRVFTKYIKGAGAAIVNVYPKLMSKDTARSYNPYTDMKIAEDLEYAGLQYVQPVNNFDRSKKPLPTEAKVPVMPDYYQSQLKNGLKIIGTKFSETPSIEIDILIEGGDLVLSSAEAKKNGIAELTSYMMNEGTQNYTTEQINAKIQHLGSYITFNADKQNTYISVYCLKKNLDSTLKLLEEKLFKPKFDAEDLKRVKKTYKEELRSEKVEPSAMAAKAFRQILYGEDNIWGASVSTKGIEKLELEDVKSYYNNYYSPSVASLVIVGDIEEKEIMPKLEFMNKWVPKDVKIQTATPVVVTSTEPQVYILEKEFAPQSVILMGQTSLPFDATGDYYKNTIVNFTLGGNFNSRLNLNLREEKGYTYGISSVFSGNKYTGQFAVSTSVKRGATGKSLEEILNEISGYLDKGITDEELIFTKSSMLNSEALGYETPSQKAGFLSEITRYNLNKDFPTQQGLILKNITKEEINQQIKKNINLNKMAIVFVGDKDIIKGQLDKLISATEKDPGKKYKLGKIKNVNID